MENKLANALSRKEYNVNDDSKSLAAISFPTCLEELKTTYLEDVVTM